MTISKFFQLTVNLLFCLSLLAAAALLRPVSLETVHAAHSAASQPSARAALRPEAASVTIIYVDKYAPGPHTGVDWTHAFTDLQDALDEAIDISADQIWVAAGIYTPTYQTVSTDTRSATFMLLEGVEMYGGFNGETNLSQRNWQAHPTILSGDLNGDDLVADFVNNEENSYHVVTADYLNQPTRLDGFIIQGGNANIEVDPFNNGGGLYNRESAANLVNLIFYKNYARQGGGLYNVDSYSLIINCAFIGNKSNFGGGLRNITSNTTLINSLFVDNSAYRAGAIYNSYSDPTIVNITVAYNSGYDQFPEPRSGGILNDNNSHLTLKNSILWGNYPNQIKNEDPYPDPSSSAELYYSLVQDDCTGFGTTCTGVSLTVDPRFENPAGLDGILGTIDDNLRLSAASPAIDAADNYVVPQDSLDINYNGILTETLPFDLDNTMRFKFAVVNHIGSGIPPIVDMGAYEAKANFLFLPLIRK